MKFNLSILTLLILSQTLVGQDYEAPVLNCLEVNGNNVNIFWDAPADATGDFDHYELFTYDTLGNFSTVIDNFNNIGQTVYTHSGTLVDTESLFYFLVAVYDDGTDASPFFVSSDTIATIDLSLFIDNSTKAILTWNYPYVSDSTFREGNYEVQMLYNGNWITLGTTAFGDESYEYVVDVCHGLAADIPLSFRIRFDVTPICGMLSNVRTGNFKDENPPTPPVIETVTVDTMTNKAVICWHPSPEADVGGYIILTADEQTVDSSTDLINTSYTNPNSLAALFSEGYLIVAEDTCFHPDPNRSSADESVPHFTINLDLEFIKCEQTNLVSWNQYQNWPQGVSHYEVYGSLQGQPMQLLDSVSASQDFYFHRERDLNQSYCYMVKALSNGDEKPSLSSITCIFTEYPEVPDFTYLANVSVESDHSIALTAVVDLSAIKSSYAFQKLDRFGEEYDTFVTVTQDAALATGEITVIDSDVTSKEEVYSYRLLSLDSCNIPFALSDTSYSMLLEVFPDNAERSMTLIWPQYEKWSGHISEYHIYRSQGDGEPFPEFPYAVVDSTRNYFVDDLSSDFDYVNSSSVCYYVEAIEAGNPFGLDQKAKTNQACGTLEPLFYVPNAMVINGVNNYFRPVGGYFDRDNYSLEIYDRWGKEMFRTEDFDIGWDATDGSGHVQEGLYAYRIRFFSGNGKEFIQQGYLSVLVAEEE